MGKYIHAVLSIADQRQPPLGPDLPHLSPRRSFSRSLPPRSSSLGRVPLPQSSISRPVRKYIHPPQISVGVPLLGDWPANPSAAFQKGHGGPERSEPHGPHRPEHFRLWTDVGSAHTVTRITRPPVQAVPILQRSFPCPTSRPLHPTHQRNGRMGRKAATGPIGGAWYVSGHSTWIPSGPGPISGHLPETCGTSALCTKIEETDEPNKTTTHAYFHTSAQPRPPRPKPFSRWRFD